MATWLRSNPSRTACVANEKGEFRAGTVVIMSAAISTAARAHRHSTRRAPWPLVKCAVAHWSADQAATIGAALAFYCALSIAPLLVIILTTAGWIVGAEAAYGHLSHRVVRVLRRCAR
jgi:hypothetical protein